MELHSFLRMFQNKGFGGGQKGPRIETGDFIRKKKEQEINYSVFLFLPTHPLQQDWSINQKVFFNSLFFGFL